MNIEHQVAVPRAREQGNNVCGECRVGHGREQSVAVAVVRMRWRRDLRFCRRRHHFRLCLVGRVMIFRIF